MNVFEFWGGPLCGERSADPEDKAVLASGHRGWYEKVYLRGKYWMMWTQRTPPEKVLA